MVSTVTENTLQVSLGFVPQVFAMANVFPQSPPHTHYHHHWIPRTTPAASPRLCGYGSAKHQPRSLQLISTTMHSLRCRSSSCTSSSSTHHQPLLSCTCPEGDYAVTMQSTSNSQILTAICRSLQNRLCLLSLSCTTAFTCSQMLQTMHPRTPGKFYLLKTPCFLNLSVMPPLSYITYLNTQVWFGASMLLSWLTCLSLLCLNYCRFKVSLPSRKNIFQISFLPASKKMKLLQINLIKHCKNFSLKTVKHYKNT